MKCSDCGSPVESGQDFCLECGEPIAGFQTGAATPAVATSPTAPTPAPAPTKRIPAAAAPAKPKIRKFVEEPDPIRCPGCGIPSRRERCPGCGVVLRRNDD